MTNWRDAIEQVDEWRFRIPRSHNPNMRVDGMIYADSQMIENIYADQAYKQVANVACLPGIVSYSLAMPDVHLGYGFAVGGVAAFDPDEGGIISPGGIGFDENCGVRLIRSNLELKDIQPKVKQLADQLGRDIPCGVGSEGRIHLSVDQLDDVMRDGVGWAVRHGYGTDRDIQHIEDSGRTEGADPLKVSQKARDRGKGQIGTLGSGNHFLEVQEVDEIIYPEAATVMGLKKGSITIMIHTGSRGFGHQVCTDYVSIALRAAQKYGISIPDRDLCCMPVNSTEGEDFLGAMRCAINFAFTNRQMLMHWTRMAFEKVLSGSWQELGLELVYDLAHNTGKFEEYKVNGKMKRLCIHRKGATRAFPPGHPQIPVDYRSIGQPVLIPGDMGRYSFVLVGAEGSMQESFGSICHGAGRLMSRTKAIKTIPYDDLMRRMREREIEVRCASKRGVVEEAPEAYKDVRQVVNVVENAGLARVIAKLRPLIVVKG